MHAADPGGKPVAHDASTYTNSVVPFLSQHCIACHGEGEANASLRLDQLQPDFSVPESAARWAEVMDQINLGQMPPPEEPSPELEQLGEVADWIAAGVRSEERRRVGSGGRALLRRMNRTEYANTIRDLLSIRFLPGESPQDLLPPDGTVDGFDKVSTGLMVDPSLLENYFELASRIAEQVVVDGPPEFPTQTMRFELEDTAANRAIDYLCANPGIECREHDILLMDHSTRSFGEMKYGDTKKEIPVAGFYRIRVRVWGTRGADGKPVRMQVRQQHPQQDRQLLIESDVIDEPQVYELLTARDPKCGEYSVSIVNGSAFQQSSPVGAKLFASSTELVGELVLGELG